MSYFKSMQIAQCRMCNSTNIHIQRNGDGLFVATCWHCGQTTQPEQLATDMEAQLRWQPLAQGDAGVNGKTTLPALCSCPYCNQDYSADFDITADEELQIIICDGCGLEFAVRPVFTLYLETYCIRKPTKPRRRKGQTA